MRHPAFAVDYGTPRRPVIYESKRDAERARDIARSVGYSGARVVQVATALPVGPWQHGMIECAICSALVPNTAQGTEHCLSCSAHATLTDADRAQARDASERG